MGLLRALVLLALVPWLPCVGLAGDRTVAWVERFEGTREQYRVFRRGQPLEIAIYMPLEDGDEIVVGREDGKVRLALAGGGVIEVMGHSSGRHVVRHRGLVPTPVTNILEWARSWFTRWHDEDVARVSISVRGGGDLSIPLVSGGQGRLTAGTRDLILAWQDGVAPFGIRFSPVDRSSPVASLGDVKQRRARLEKVVLRPGLYRVHLADALGAVAVGTFLVVSHDQRPDGPAEVKGSVLSHQARETLVAF